MAVSIIARRQPMALDLRQIITVIHVASDLERIGDLAKNIAKRAVAIAGEQRPKHADHRPQAYRQRRAGAAQERA